MKLEDRSGNVAVKLSLSPSIPNCYHICFSLFAGELFAICPVDAFPGLAVEPVSDSSRYFVLRLKDPSGMHIVLRLLIYFLSPRGRHAFVGLGFQDRGDAFDFNVSLMEHFK